MGWVLVAVVYVGALWWSWSQQKKVAECRDVCLDFGDQVDEVEQALRMLAYRAERQGLCLNVYISANDDEAKAIAYRLGPSMPLNLVLEPLPGTNKSELTEGKDLLLGAHSNRQG